MRRIVVQIHLWLGLTIGLLWAFLGLTGSILVFHRDLDRLATPPPTPGPIASLDLIIENASAAANGASIIKVATSDERRDTIYAYYVNPDDPVFAGGQKQYAVTLDAATARPVANRNLYPYTPFNSSVTRWLLVTHYSLLSGQNGRTIIGATGLFLLSALVAGLWLGWPKRGAWKLAFSFEKWRKPQQQLYGWHRAVGLVACSVLIISATSGAYMNFKGPIKSFLSKTVPFHSEYKPKPVETLPADMISAQQAVDIAKQHFPSSTWVRVFLPVPNAPVYTVRVRMPGEGRAWLGASRVKIDPVAGSILEVYDSTSAPAANRLSDAMFALHNGDFFRLPGRLLMFLAGLTLPALYITGLMAWLGKRRRKAARRHNDHRNGRPAAFSRTRLWRFKR